MDQQAFAQEQNQGAAANLAEIFMEGATRVIELQAAAARALLHTHARGAAVLGWPDWSRFVTDSDAGRTLFDAGTQQVIDSLRATQRTMAELQQQLGRIMQQQTRQVSEQVRETIEEIGRRSREGMEEWRRSTAQGAGQVQRATEDMGQALRKSGDMAHAAPSLIVPAAEAGVTAEARTAEERARSRRNG